MTSTYPSLEEIKERIGTVRQGTPIFTIRMSLLSIMSYFFWLGLVLGISAVILLRFPTGHLGGLSIWWLLLFPLGIFLEILRRKYDDSYIFFPDKIEQKAGQLSLRYNRPVISYDHIVLVVVKQDLMGRIFNYGDVELSSAAEDTNEILITGVRAPRELADLVESLRAEHLPRGRSAF